MTRNDATAMNHLCQWIAGPGAAEINYHGLQPQSRLGPAPEPLPSRASLRTGKLDSCRLLSIRPLTHASPLARGPAQTRARPREGAAAVGGPAVQKIFSRPRTPVSTQQEKTHPKLRVEAIEP